jgi:Tfp pilus assembly protein PilX
MTRRHVLNNERGGGLLMALLIVVALTAIAAGIIASVSTDRRVTSYNMSRARALNLAESGVAEAMERIRAGDVPSNLNPRMVTQVYMTTPGNVPTAGADTTCLSTAQPQGRWLPYSSDVKGPDVLTIRYMTDATSSGIYRYDRTKNPSINPVTGEPVYVITSPARVGNSRRSVEASVSQVTMNLSLGGAVMAGVDVKLSGNIVVCGNNHLASTPANTGDVGRTGIGGCAEDATHWETGSGDMTGIWSTGSVQSVGGAKDYGTPAENGGQAGFYGGPWEPLGMSQSGFYSWVGQPLKTEPADLDGIYYLDNNTVGQDQSGSFTFHGVTGSGFLYVDGDLTLNSTFTYRGLIYVEGNLKLNGSAWILGALIVRGKSKMQNTGGATILYSDDAVRQNIIKYGNRFVTLSWREL